MSGFLFGPDQRFALALKIGISADIFAAQFVGLKLARATSMPWGLALAPIWVYALLFLAYAVVEAALKRARKRRAVEAAARMARSVFHVE